MLKPSSITIITRALWHYTAHRRLMLGLLYGLNIINNVISLAGPYILGQIINTLQEQGKAGAPVALKWVMLLALFQISVHAINAFTHYMTSIFGDYVGHVFKKSLYHKIQSLPLLWHQDHHSGNLISRLYSASSALSQFIDFPSQFIRTFISFAGTVIILLNIAPTLGLITFVMSIITLFISRFFINKIKHFAKLSRELNHSLSAALSDYISNIRSIITLRLGQQTNVDLDKRITDTIIPSKVEARWRSKRDIGVDFFVETITISCIAYLIFSFSAPDNLMKIGTVVMVITYLRDMSFSIYGFNWLYRGMSQAVTEYEGIDFVDKAYDEYIAKHKPNETHIKNWLTIGVDSLDFSYQTDLASTALDNLSFALQRGQKIALVGASGGGKSTLMSVLRGLYPANGRTIMDGKQFDSIEPLASISTLIPQDPEIFENTIRYNITLGVEHSDDEILEACRIACFDTVLADLPNGLDSKINEKGVNLSGGQKQRLALARGIFAIRESSLVLFDEPTSSVDSMTERLLYQNLFAAFPDICLISSIHRLNLLNQFDTIWVMEKGRLVQQGSVDSLMEDKDQPFYKLWAAYQATADE